MKRFYIFLIILATTTSSFAQNKRNPKFSLTTPYHTIYTHLYFLQEDSYKPELAAKTMNVDNPEKAQKLAVELKNILDGKGLYVELDNIPDQKNYYDSAAEKHKYVLFDEYPMIYVEKVGNKWLYSKRTIEAIPGLYKEVYPFGTDKLISLVPKIGQKKILGLAIWKHIGILIFIFLSFVFYKILSWIISLIIPKLIRRFVSGEEKTKIVKVISRSLSFLLVLLLLNLFIPVLQLPIKVSKYLFLALRAFVPFMVMLVLYRAVDIFGIYLESLAHKTESTLDDQVVPLVRKSLKIFVVISGLLFILQNLEFDITALLAGLSIGGLAFALAAQDTIKNLFGSLMIFIDRPFQVGDWIVGSGIDGSVESVGFRSTRVRTFHNSLIYVPNGRLADMTIDNMGLRRYRRMYANIAVTYDTPPELLEVFLEGIEKIVLDHPNVWKENYHVRFTEMKDFSLNIMLYIFFDVPTWKEELKCKEEILLSIKRLAENMGVRFAFPTQTLHVEDFPEKESLTPNYTDNKESFRNKMLTFLSKK